MHVGMSLICKESLKMIVSLEENKWLFRESKGVNGHVHIGLSWNKPWDHVWVTWTVMHGSQRVKS